MTKGASLRPGQKGTPRTLALVALLVFGSQGGCLKSEGGSDGAIQHGPRPEFANAEAFLADRDVCLPPNYEELNLPERRPMAVRCFGDATDDATLTALGGRYTFRMDVVGGNLYIIPPAPLAPTRAPPVTSNLVVTFSPKGGGRLDFVEEAKGVIDPTGTPAPGDTDATDIAEEDESSDLAAEGDDPSDAGEAGDAAEGPESTETEAPAPIVRTDLSFTAQGAHLRAGPDGLFTLYWVGSRKLYGCEQYVSLVFTFRRRTNTEGATTRLEIGDGPVPPDGSWLREYSGDGAVIVWDAVEDTLGSCGFVRPRANPRGPDGPAGYKFRGNLTPAPLATP